MLVKSVQAYIESKGLISRGDSVLVALSGGADSMALLYVLSELRASLDFTLASAHLNHGIRGRAACEDATFAEEISRRLGISHFQGCVDTPSFAGAVKLSMEEAARELRNEFLRERALAGSYSKIALGHTMEDQAETVLMHLIRGAGVRGASGMKAMSRIRSGPDLEVSIIRPFLATRRAEIRDFLASRGLSFREDESNTDVTFMRNRIRFELLELLREKYNPHIIEILCSHAALVTEAEDYLSKVGSEAYQHCLKVETGENIELEVARLVSYHTCVQTYVLREAFRRLRGGLKDLGSTHVASLINLVSSGQEGNSVDIASGVSARLKGRTLWIGRTSVLRLEDTRAPSFLVRIEPGKEVCLPEISLRIYSEVLDKDAQKDKPEGGSTPKNRLTEERVQEKLEKISLFARDSLNVFFDLEKLAPPLVLRNIEPGDRLAPFGMKGSKKIQDLLVDLKMPRSQRMRTAVLCDAKQILWLVGVRRSRVAPVTAATRLILNIGVNQL